MNEPYRHSSPVYYTHGVSLIYYPLATVKDAELLVNSIEQQTSGGIAFSQPRWPYTYAYDYMREHDIQGCGDKSRGDCAAMLRDNPYKEKIVRIFARAHCKQYDIVVPSDADFNV